jgi:hypothetical protein
MKQIAYADDLYVNRLKVKSIAYNRDGMNMFVINK